MSSTLNRTTDGGTPGAAPGDSTDEESIHKNDGSDDVHGLVRKVTVDVAVQEEIVAAVAYRAGIRAGGAELTESVIDDLVSEHVQVWPRFLVAGEEKPVADWFREAVGMPIAPERELCYPDDVAEPVIEIGENAGHLRTVRAAIARAIREPDRRQVHIDEALDELEAGGVPNAGAVRQNLVRACELIDQDATPVDVVANLQGAYGFTAGEGPDVQEDRRSR